MDPLARLFGSPARLKLLRLFLFNDDRSFSVADAAFRTKTPKDAARREVNALVTVGVVKKKAGKEGPSFTANTRFAHFGALCQFLRTSTSLDDAEILTVLKRAGGLKLVILSGIFSDVVESKIDLLVVGDRLDEKALDQSVHKLEAELGRELRFAAFTTDDFKYRVGVYDRLIRDVLDFPHRVLHDKMGFMESR
jgi:predicted nucleotidyltransferase